jgi:hypothetical protein
LAVYNSQQNRGLHDAAMPLGTSVDPIGRALYTVGTGSLQKSLEVNEPVRMLRSPTVRVFVLACPHCLPRPGFSQIEVDLPVLFVFGFRCPAEAFFSVTLILALRHDTTYLN